MFLQTLASAIPTFEAVPPYKPTRAALAGRQLVGARIREARLERGMSQEALAHAAGLDRSFLAEVEAGKHSLMLDRLFDLASALEVATSWLLTTPTSESSAAPA